MDESKRHLLVFVAPSFRRVVVVDVPGGVRDRDPPEGGAEGQVDEEQVEEQRVEVHHEEDDVDHAQGLQTPLERQPHGREVHAEHGERLGHPARTGEFV